MSGREVLLEARKLGVRIGERQICRGLDFRLHAGERLAILGRNGAGKSTLLSALAGLRPANEGEVWLAGQPMQHYAARDAARQRGWLGQHQADPFAATVLETALAGRHPHLGRWEWENDADREIALQALAAVGMDKLAHRSMQQLSGGERQRAAIATLLTQAPRLCLLDEPLAHLDLNHQIGVLELFSAKARDEGVGVVMVLHDPGLAARYCDRVLLIYEDGQTEEGPVERLLDSPRLTCLYGHPLQRVEVEGRCVFLPL